MRGLDIRTPQLSIQAKIIFVDRTDIEQLGIKYDLGSQTQFFNKLVQRPDPGDPGELSTRTSTSSTSAATRCRRIGNANADIAGSALDLIFSTAIGGFALTTFLSALERPSWPTSRPSRSSRRSTTARPTSWSVRKRRSASSTPTRAAGGTARANVQFKETGIRLTVTPHVTNNRQVLMQLHTERSAIQPLAAADLGFIFQKQKADNQLLVNDGETAVIGGLTVTQVTKTRSGIPLLGSLPIIGKLFSFTSDTGKPARPHYLGHAPDHRRRRLGSVAASRGPSEHPDGNEPGARRARSLYSADGTGAARNSHGSRAG